MHLYLGVITKVVDKLKFVIEFTIKDYIEAKTAYPIDLSDQPLVGDTVAVYELESILGYSYLYKKLRLEQFTRISIGDNMIQLNEDSIDIITKNGPINVNGDGDIVIRSKSNITIQTAKTIDIKGGTIKMNGTVTPGKGPFNCIPVCPVTGQPHSGSIVMG